ncbi:MAG: hypothetical protein JSW62_01470 [Thermoplasmatales archaeon]|nr:MAG: hypothetical protein JSW62_01470 [Thermoplasmatales archaeon]
MSNRKSNKPRNHTVGEQRNIDLAENVVIFPNTLTSDIYIDSDDRIDGDLGSAIYENKNNIITAQVSRVGLKFADFSYNIPNSNTRNQQYKFEVIGGSGEIIFNLPIKDYLTAADLFADIKTQMETEALSQAGVVIVVSFTEINNTGKYSMSSTVGFSWSICNGISYGGNLHGMHYTHGFITDIEIIPRLFYTRYIDILITEIRDAKIMTHKFTQPKRFNVSNHLTRLYIPFIKKIDDNGLIVQKQSKNFQRENININHYPFRHRDITSFRITLIDEFQEPLAYETQTILNINPTVNFIEEIPYVKYSLVLSIIG